MEGSLVLCFKKQSFRLGEKGFKINDFIQDNGEHQEGFNSSDFRSISSEIDGIPFKIEDCEKICLLGKGAFGYVHKYLHKPTGKFVAIKVI